MCLNDENITNCKKEVVGFNYTIKIGPHSVITVQVGILKSLRFNELVSIKILDIFELSKYSKILQWYLNSNF